jgi:hypothetical protein
MKQGGLPLRALSPRRTPIGHLGASQKTQKHHYKQVEDFTDILKNSLNSIFY